MRMTKYMRLQIGLAAGIFVLSFVRSDTIWLLCMPFSAAENWPNVTVVINLITICVRVNTSSRRNKYKDANSGFSEPNAAFLLKTLCGWSDMPNQEILDAMAGASNLTEKNVAIVAKREAGGFYQSNCVGKSHLRQAGLITSPRRGIFHITDRGGDVLRSRNPINIAILNQFSEYQAFRAK